MSTTKSLRFPLMLAGLLSGMTVVGDTLYGQDHTPADTGGLILLVLGVLALVSGARNLRDLRNKRLTPPRPPSRDAAKPRPADPEQ